MYLADGQLVLSASDLINFLECTHLTHLDHEVAHGRLAIQPIRDDTTELVARKGDEHERAYLASLHEEGRKVVEIPAAQPGLASVAAAAAATAQAMRDGAEVIFQGVLFDGGRRRGTADFLERVERPSALGSWSYEVADTKLARRVKPYYLLQLCFYADLLAGVQGALPERIHVVLGTRRRESFRTAAFFAYYRRVRGHFLAVLEGGLAGTYPDPVPHCRVCKWSDHCDARRVADDHLSLVAGMGKAQVVRLAERGIVRLDQLAAARDGDRPPRVSEPAFVRLRHQARLQLHERTTGAERVDVLDAEPGQAFERLPARDPGDLWFDMEGDPFFDGGLEYLFGAGWVEGGEFRYRSFWADDRDGEKRAFEGFMDFVDGWLDEHPAAHVYHYAPYEPSALKRLMGMHATREAQLDRLLREKRLVDLYAVVRQGVRISKPSYSIKKVEAFYRGAARDAAVTDGADSIVQFERYLETGDAQIRADITAYNRDDCLSTLQLRDWLLERREKAIAWFGRALAFRPVAVDTRREPRADDADTAALAGGDALLGHLLEYHRREAKPAWWEYFARLEASEEHLIEVDNEALGGIRDGRFPPQEHKVAPGEFVDPATGRRVRVLAVDDAAGTLELEPVDPPPRALIPQGPYDTRIQQGALRRFAAQRGAHPAGYAVLRREAPRFAGLPPGAPLQAGRFELDRALELAARLDGSYLFIQGPPGSGKTYSGAHVILRLIAEGRRVGVASTTHKAIHNLLDEVERFAGPPFRGLKKGSRESAYQGRLITSTTSNAAMLDPEVSLVAGTAWLFAHPDLERSLDVLVIDEAGQVSLADALAMGTSARNLVLLGDPLQLAQVSQGTHPPGAAASVLEHLLGDEPTVPGDRGLFIDRTRRMHPDVCAFVSEVVYEGRLHAIAGCERQRVDGPGLSGTGLRDVPVAHAGNSRSSEEEVEAIAAAVAGLRGATVTRPDGTVEPLRDEHVMVVTPYNAQVRCLRERLPDGVQVGTVDKFQGRQAAVVFFSMATSSGAELPRNLEFLFSRNRLNVAISRAQCLAVLVCSPELLRIRCRTAEQMELVNALCRFVEMAAGHN